MDSRKLTRAKKFLRYFFGIFFVAAGVNHFRVPEFYLSIMPPYLPWPLLLVEASGLCEIGLGALLLVRAFSKVAAWGLILLLIAVFPANIHMALHPDQFASIPVVILWLRLPLQGVLIAWAYWHTYD